MTLKNQISTALSELNFTDLNRLLSAPAEAISIPAESTADRIDRLTSMLESLTTLRSNFRTGSTVPATPVTEPVIRMKRVSLPEGETVASALGITVETPVETQPEVTSAESQPVIPPFLNSTDATPGIRMELPKRVESRREPREAKTPAELAEIWNEWPEDFRSLGMLTLSDAAKEVGVDIADLGRQKQAIYERVYEARAAAGMPVPAKPATSEEFDFRKLDIADLRNQLQSLGVDPAPYGVRKREIYLELQRLNSLGTPAAAPVESVVSASMESDDVDSIYEEVTEDDFAAVPENEAEAFAAEQEESEQELQSSDEEVDLEIELGITSSPNPFVTREVQPTTPVTTGSTARNLLSILNGAQDIDLEKIMG